MINGYQLFISKNRSTRLFCPDRNIPSVTATYQIAGFVPQRSSFLTFDYIDFLLFLFFFELELHPAKDAAFNNPIQVLA